MSPGDPAAAGAGGGGHCFRVPHAALPAFLGRFLPFLRERAA